MHTSHTPQQKHLLINRKMCEYIRPEKLGINSGVRKVCYLNISGVITYLVYDSSALGTDPEGLQSCNEYPGLGRWAGEPFKIISSKNDADLYHEIISENSQYDYQDISDEIREGMIDFMRIDDNTTSVFAKEAVTKET